MILLLEIAWIFLHKSNRAKTLIIIYYVQPYTIASFAMHALSGTAVSYVCGIYSMFFFLRLLL